MQTNPRAPAILLVTLAGIFLWSGLDPHDRFTWFLEVLPVILGVGLLLATYSRFRFTALVYGLIWLHALILMVGGHYTYSEVPLGHWAREAFHLSRNHYDRLGHFAQGFVPAMIARELLLRTSPLKRGKWLFVLVVSVCLAISAFYELTEWWVALAKGEAAQAFLGTQGDIWDTQWDMFLALVGAITALGLLGGWHDRQLEKI